MLSKYLRVLIADACQHRRFAVEKLLNREGCFAIAVAGSVEELLALSGVAGRPFDAVLINCQLLDNVSVDALEALGAQSNVVLYESLLVSGHLADPLTRVQPGLCGLPGVTRVLH